MIYNIKVAIVIELILLLAVALFRSSLRTEFRYVVGASDVMLMAVIPLIALFGYDKTIFYGFLFVAPLFWIADPVGLAKRYVLALVSFPELSTHISIGSHYFGSWSALLALNAGALVALTVTKRRSLENPLSIEFAFWLVCLIALLMSARGADLISTVRAALAIFVLLVPSYYIVLRTLGSAKAMADVICFVVLGGMCNACIGIVEGAKHWSLYQSFAGALHVQLGLIGASLSVRAGFLRAGGAFVNYEMLGLFCGMSLLATISIRRRFTSFGLSAIIVILGIGLLVSQARSAWIATAVGLVVQAVYDRRWGRVAACIGSFGMIAALVLTVLPHGGTASQLIGMSGHGAGSNEYRQHLLDRGIEEARKHPWTGQTLNQLQVSMNDLRQGEHIIDLVNTHLNVLLIGGVGALTVWLFAWCILLIQGWRHRPVGGRNQDPLHMSLPFAWMIMILLFLAFTSAVDRAFPFTAMSMALMGVCLRLGKRAEGYTNPRSATPVSRNAQLA